MMRRNALPSSLFLSQVIYCGQAVEFALKIDVRGYVHNVGKLSISYFTCFCKLYYSCLRILVFNILFAAFMK